MFSSRILPFTILVALIGVYFHITSNYIRSTQSVYNFQNESLNKLIKQPSIFDSIHEIVSKNLNLKNIIDKESNIDSRDTLYNPVKHGHQKLSSNSYFDNPFPYKDRSQIGIENATLVMLVRNSELEGALQSMRSLEDRFNKDYRYPWVFLNEVPFDEDFKERTTLMASSKTYYELIPESDWEPPSYISESKIEENIQESIKNGIIYGFSRAYRNMCHFNSGFFYKQKRLLNYDWYFRVEPDVEYMCDFQYDPFTFLRQNEKQYGFVIAIHEYENTIPTLWQTVENFMKEYPQHLHKNNSIKFITSKENSLNQGQNAVNTKTDYNGCHFWSNFEIGNLNFFRGDAYEAYFNYLDKAGGFYYERWGDAPVHSIGLSLLMDKAEIHHFEDIGYYHVPYMACPTSSDVISSKRCICKTKGLDNEVLTKPVDVDPFSCLPRWWRYGSGKNFLNEIDYTFNH